jgi:hypothetical protein
MGTLNIETNSIDVIKKLALQLPDSRWAVWQSVPREGGKVGKIPHSGLILTLQLIGLMLVIAKLQA